MAKKGRYFDSPSPRREPYNDPPPNRLLETWKKERGGKEAVVKR